MGAYGGHVPYLDSFSWDSDYVSIYFPQETLIMGFENSISVRGNRNNSARKPSQRTNGKDGEKQETPKLAAAIKSSAFLGIGRIAVPKPALK